MLPRPTALSPFYPFCPFHLPSLLWHSTTLYTYRTASYRCGWRCAQGDETIKGWIMLAWGCIINIFDSLYLRPTLHESIVLSDFERAQRVHRDFPATKGTRSFQSISDLEAIAACQAYAGHTMWKFDRNWRTHKGNFRQVFSDIKFSEPKRATDSILSFKTDSRIMMKDLYSQLSKCLESD